MFQVIDTEEDVLSAEQARQDTAAAASSSASTEEDVPVRLVDATTNRPHQHRPYRLELTDKVIEGVTDADGLTRPLSSSERAALVTWHVTSAPTMP